ncbi:MAG TPA: UDP-N-acetylmuramoyl-tripeptide--D-alanyl-D-alanine ligase [candidate division Zixibacteria bacterium]|nr:UDP-N-acetylmuramoyl-tripeptide--D-alanyl-D-alanine ligase [candidate division Zixibacteria bacterium]
MISRDFNTLALEVNGKLLNNEFATAVFSGVAIDSRVVRGEQLFVAIEGENDDGHRYIGNVVQKNCAGLLVNNNFTGTDEFKNRVAMVAVDDSHRAMITLAQNYRDESDTKLIAVTGSNGKTTTKEIIYSFIRNKTNKTYRSPGNYNNLFGLPLAIFDMPSDTEYAVFELGISVAGEMRQLARIAQPEVVLMTNIGPTHLETLGSMENVAEEKFSLADAIGPEKIVILNADDPTLMQAAARRKRDFVTYGFGQSADYMAKKAGISASGFPQITIDGKTIEIKLFGEHQVYNVLAAYATCRAIGLDITSDDLASLQYNFSQYRGEIENICGLTVIADCYNANPCSMESGLNSFRNYLNLPEMENRPGIVIVGDMLELGKESIMYHRRIGKLLAELKFENVIAVGSLSGRIYDAAKKAGLKDSNINYFTDVSEAGDFLIGNLPRGGVIYLKASRGIGLEKLITLLKGSAFRDN